MADFQEWLDATAIGGDAGHDYDGGFDFLGGADDGKDENGAPRNERDAVLFCIDCHASAFTVPPGSPDGTLPPFSAFVRHAVRFYQDKIVTSDRDLLGLVLFGTEHQCNPHGFPHVYTFHELDLNSAARVQELEILAAAASPAAAIAAEFRGKIGHADVKHEPDGTLSTRPRAALSELLWAVLHMFNNLGPKRVAFKRAFLFTCEEDPTGGNPVERAKCLARARDLREHGVHLDVFGHGMDFAPSVHFGSSGLPQSQDLSTGPRIGVGSARSASPYPNSTPAGASLTPGAAAPTAYQPPILTSSGGTAPSPTPHHVPGLAARAAPDTAAVAVATALPAFDRRRFWDALVNVSDPHTPHGLTSGADRGSSIGSVHVGDLSDANFAGSLPEHRMRTYPQRAMKTLALSIGADASAPTVDVSVFLPVVPCPRPKFVWLEASTNALITSETRMLARDSGATVNSNDLVHTAKVGAGDSVKFAPDEVDRIKKQFGPPGIRILGFRAESQLRAKWSIGKSSFLAPKEDSCGHNGLVFFRELHAKLVSSKRYAVAEIIARDGMQPRLVALVAATAANTASAAVEPGSCGFHMVPLPYADDYRSLTVPQGTCCAPPDGAVDRAKAVVQSLTVDFDPSSVPNPSLQRQYHLLQQLAVMDDDQKPPEDLSLPDREGMRSFATLFTAFQSSWGSAADGYNPEAFAPLPKPAKPAPTSDEMAAIDMDSLQRAGQLTTLTMPYLKQFLKEHHEATSGNKQELVDRVSALVQKKRDKRGREDE
eukprot:CAMPEP_0174845316 /NCGR_PEP_ID=MMETSP1114-20130205/11654_1 /TAXON_ID=312471 /ORGANISM="Neobodo designis, Strain CCAP 1951/1" /LENGTH=768 /DNA_ID=CAMNT_0016079563 /DNA_START=42 /DNA_END=2348 /DNA_ORIENTATION=+